MKYIRKTKDEWQIQQYFGAGYGWQEACAEESWAEARQRLKEYRENQPEYPARVKKVRVKL